ncbi:MAG: ABC transporter substrate-binding protein, partial [Chloroflexi bacterium]|nr:ABC transporter substrate-binding protein [Chloroflexota bacterium]
MKKLLFIMLSVGLLVILAACGGDAETDSELVKIKVSDNGNTGNAPIYIALAEGFFTDQGLDIELVPLARSSEAIAAMISGDIDVVPSSNSVALWNAVTFEEGIQVVHSHMEF